MGDSLVGQRARPGQRLGQSVFFVAFFEVSLDSVQPRASASGQVKEKQGKGNHPAHNASSARRTMQQSTPFSFRNSSLALQPRLSPLS